MNSVSFLNHQNSKNMISNLTCEIWSTKGVSRMRYKSTVAEGDSP